MYKAKSKDEKDKVREEFRTKATVLTYDISCLTSILGQLKSKFPTLEIQNQLDNSIQDLQKNISTEATKLYDEMHNLLTKAQTTIQEKQADEKRRSRFQNKCFFDTNESTSMRALLTYQARLGEEQEGFMLAAAKDTVDSGEEMRTVSGTASDNSSLVTTPTSASVASV